MFIDNITGFDLDNYNKELWFIDYSTMLCLDDLPGEIWKDIGVIDDINFTGYYQESNFGRTKSLSRLVTNTNKKKQRVLKERILRVRKEKNGYCRVILYKHGKHYIKQVHRLVGFCFIKNNNPQNKTIINHIDENPSNNCVYNLEWCTPKYNSNYGNAIQKRVDKTKIPVVRLSLNGEVIQIFDKIADVVSIGCDTSSVTACCKKKRITHKNCVWMYKEEYDKIGQNDIKKYLNQLLSNKRSRQIVQLSINNEFIKIWSEATEASVAGFSPRCIRLCCCHEIKTHKGYKWMYKTEYDKLTSQTI